MNTEQDERRVVLEYRNVVQNRLCIHLKFVALIGIKAEVDLMKAAR